MTSDESKDLALQSLDALKAEDLTAIPLAGKSDLADFIIIASANSQRHLQALTQRVAKDAKESGQRVWGIEGENSTEWALVDLGDVIVHVMRPEARARYALEKLWSLPPTRG